MIQASRNRFILAFGSNVTAHINDCVSQIGLALSQIKATSLKVERVSSFWRTPAFPAGAGPDFANACAVCSCAQSPDEVLALVHGIEAAMGRVRVARWGQRVIDIDLLAAGGTILPDLATWRHWHDLSMAEQMQRAPAQLILPHPRLQDRAFVLVPMAEVAPDWVHPVLGWRVSRMLAALDPAHIAAMQKI